MPETFTTTIKWLGNLTKVFFKTAPSATILVVLMTLASQLAMILSFLLPLKVVMLLGSENNPSFIPPPFNQIDKNKLILSLVALALIFYIFHIISSKISLYASHAGVKKLLDKTHKIILFEQQDALASKVYSKYAEALASIIFSVLALVLLILFYPKIGYFLATFISLCVGGIGYLLRISATFETVFSEKSQTIINGLSGVGFMMVFIFIVIDFLYLRPPIFVAGLIAIILSRLLLVRLSIGFNHINFLTKQHNKVNALFFHKHVFVPSQIDGHRQEFFGHMLSPTYRRQWIETVIKEATGESVNNFSSTWLQLGLKNIIALKVDIQDLSKSLLIKLYDLNKSSAAQHEATLLLSEDIKELPILPFLLSTQVSGYQCHVFDMTGYRALNEDEAQRYEVELFISINCSSPPLTLYDRYSRSKVMIWDKLNVQTIEQLTLIADNDELHNLKVISLKLPDLKRNIKKLPISIVAPIHHNLIMLSSNNQPVLIDWGAWKLEPALSKWKEKYSDFITFDSAVKQAQIRRPELQEFTIEKYKYALILSNFLDFYQRGLYKDAIGALKEVPDTKAS